MPNYLRTHTGITWFFTVNLWKRKNNTLLVDEIALFRHAVKIVLRKYPFYIDAWVVLPEHMHCVWTLPADDSNYSLRWRLIKSEFAKHIEKQEYRSNVRIARSERGIWQRRFWEHQIRDERDYENHINYIYINPVKHKLVKHVSDWPYSTFHRDVQRGIYSPDWCGDIELSINEFDD